MVRLLSLICVSLLAGCAGNAAREECPMPERELVPVQVARRPPASLLEPLPAPAPSRIFRAPCDPKITYEWGVCGATSMLDTYGETELRRWVDSLTLRLEAWKEWADEGGVE